MGERVAVMIHLPESVVRQLDANAKASGRTRKSEVEIRVLDHYMRYKSSYMNVISNKGIRFTEVEDGESDFEPSRGTSGLILHLKPETYEALSKSAARSMRSRKTEAEVRITDHLLRFQESNKQIVTDKGVEFVAIENDD